MSQVQQDLDFIADTYTRLSTGGYSGLWDVALSIFHMHKGCNYSRLCITRPIPYGIDPALLAHQFKDDLHKKLTDQQLNLVTHGIDRNHCDGSDDVICNQLVSSPSIPPLGIVGHITYTNTPVTLYITVSGDESFIALMQKWYQEDNKNTPHLHRLKYLNMNKCIITDVVPLPDYTSLQLHAEAYPDITESPKEMWDAFAAASANVLLLIGDVGTGKSSWIREMMNQRGWDGKAYVVDSANVLMAPEFSDFIRELPAGSVLICEDNDMLTRKRTDDNIHMSALLNATSGLIATSLKIIITSNLNSVDEMDTGIIRPGRLFDVVNFRKLTVDEATTLYTKISGRPQVFDKPMSLAEVMNYHERRGVRNSHRKTIGFR